MTKCYQGLISFHPLVLDIYCNWSEGLLIMGSTGSGAFILTSYFRTDMLYSGRGAATLRSLIV